MHTIHTFINPVYMKRNHTNKRSFSISFGCILFVLFVTFNMTSIAQPPPPPPNVGHGQGSNSPPGAGAPIGDGIFILLGLAGLYAGKKIFVLRNEMTSE